jgi:hypothetical protein
MKPVRVLVWGCALATLAAGAAPARAAWCNVFQVCCASCGHSSAYVAPAAPVAVGVAADPCNPCCPPPQRVCTTRYIQRSFYVPVTCYQTRSYYERVTSYRTSYFWEPVTSCRCSWYFDPCTCCYKQVCCPTTCYQLRSQCCPVESWVQRCCQVPVTTYQQSCYWEPVTTCCEVPSCPCSTPCPCPSATPAIGAVPGAATAPAVPPATGTIPPQGVPPAAGSYPPQPGVNEQRSVPVPGVGESHDNGTSNGAYNGYRQYPPQNGTPGASLNRPLPPQTPAPPAAPMAAPPKVRLDHIVMGPGPSVEGQVVGRDRNPHAGAELLFVSAERQGSQHAVRADGQGLFHVGLTSGGWLVYVRGADGTPVFKSRIDVREEETKKMTLVSR